MKPDQGPKLYGELAPWFHLLTSPADYAGEAEFIRKTIVEASENTVRSVLELGSGGGNNALHLKRHFELTLVDLSPGMLEESRKLNPECRHLQGDMRSIRLGTLFDAVLVHDAVMYMTTGETLLQAMTTASMHCRPRGAVLVLPDFVRETFHAGIHHGGHDGEGRSLRYLEWTFDADPADTIYTVDFAILLREGKQPVQVVHDTHEFGLFSRQQWLTCLAEAGLDPRAEKDPFDREVFVGLKR